MVLDGAVDPNQDAIGRVRVPGRRLRAGLRRLRRLVQGQPTLPDRCGSARPEVSATAGCRADRAGHRPGRRARRRPAGCSSAWSRRCTPRRSGRTSPRQSPRWTRRRARRVRAGRRVRRTAAGRARTATCSTPSNTVITVTTTTAETWRRSARCQSEWRTKYPLFGAPLAVGLLTCTSGRESTTRTRPAGGRRTADRGRRHDRRPGHAVRADRKLAAMLGVGRCSPGRARATPPTRRPVHRNAVDEYLINLTLPPVGEICPNGDVARVPAFYSSNMCQEVDGCYSGHAMCCRLAAVSCIMLLWRPRSLSGMCPTRPATNCLSRCA